MYVIREVMQCKPGQVRGMVTKFKELSKIVQGLGYKPFRVFTDVSGKPFWTVVAETETETIDGFIAMEANVMANEEARRVMANYHDLVDGGRREIYKAED